jgi:TRAP-type mannitol/chloroaromatic compound transport system substrate-binding protein
MLARYDTRNSEALEKLLKTGVQLRAYSQEILEAAEKASFALYDEFAAKDADFKAVYEQWKPFRDRMYAWNNLNEGSFSRYAYGKLKVGN